ncbi:receptor-like protein 56 [Macadamia integrifolia]|uniref:receptor-like protein 56 n=1 Tax=Macadamia integrifolia TaxID=60698 RepID=UPI001C4E4A8F|nr:receptor-like protein 56 [Macadamia integrifolia]
MSNAKGYLYMYMSFLSTLPNMKSLDLSYNFLIEASSSSHTKQGSTVSFVGLGKLESLHLYGNHINNGILPFLGVLTSLKTLFLGYNNFDGLLHMEVLCGMKRLQQILDLSGNQFKGNIPSSLITSLSSLSHIILGYNDFEGTFTFQIFANHSKLDVIDLDSAGSKLKLETEHPPWVPLFQLKTLLLSNCNLKKQSNNAFPSFLSTQYNLREVDLSHCNLSGLLPPSLLKSNKLFSTLILRNNSLRGHFFLPSYVHNAARNINISNNRIDGLLQENIGNLFPNAKYLNLSKNNFESGNIPSSILQMLYLDNNSFSGNILREDYPSATTYGKPSFRIHSISIESNKFTTPPFARKWIHRSPSIALINNSNLLTLDIRSNNLCGSIPDWMGALSSLRVLLFQGNHLNGPIPNHLCQLEWICLMDLFHNSLSGSIHRCFNYISFGRRIEKESISNIKSEGLWGTRSTEVLAGAVEEIEFMTKSMYFSFRGGILNFMSVMDLSFINLMSDIPHEIGTLNGIHALNLSHNQLIGSIPKAFSNLKQIESLDLSYNRLTGKIPSELTTLYNLEVFTVAYNNLSDKTPEMKGQFSTFDSFSYEGNPYLYGLPLPKTSFCSSSGESTNTFATTLNDMENEDEIDMTAFASSFAASYVVCLLDLPLFSTSILIGKECGFTSSEHACTHVMIFFLMLIISYAFMDADFVCLFGKP